jgi:hypothetical protein
MNLDIRELRRKLTRHVDRVRDREGVVTPASPPKRRTHKPIKAKGTVSDLVADQRR